MKVKRDKSILQPDMSSCYICGKRGALHIHEVFYGTANRKKSIAYGCYVSLCPEHHNMSNDGVHLNKALDNSLKMACQKRFEELYGHEKFMEVFHRNYI